MVFLIKKLRNCFLVKVIWRRYKISPGFYAGVRVRLWARDILVIGRDFYIGRDSFIETNCIIGDYVLFGNKVGVVGRYDHHFQQVGEPIRHASVIRDSAYSWKGKDLVTVIENDVWVGYGSTILQGVTIHEGAIIAAGSVVTKDVEPYSIYAGNPARKIKNRFDTDSDLKAHVELSKKYYNRLQSETHNSGSFDKLSHLRNFF